MLKEKDFKLTEVNCQLTTAELKMKLLEEQIAIFEKDLRRGTSSDNLSDAIEVFKLLILNKTVHCRHKILGEKSGNKGEE